MMTRLKAEHIKGIEALDQRQLHAVMSALEPHRIGCLNWEDFPYCPDVHFRIACSDNAIAIMFEVKENHVKAVAMEDHGPVWKDSCVEFFAMCADGSHYINFEMNCIGTLLAAKRTSRKDPERIGSEEFETIRRFTSLPHEPIDTTGENLSWWAIEVIPFSILGYSTTPEAIRANLYKCGDACNPAHFLSWSPIPLPKPDFHCPDFFGEITLGKPTPCTLP